MRKKIELPDDLLKRAKEGAALDRVSRQQYIVEAGEARLRPRPERVRRRPPVFGSARARPVGVLTPEQIDEAMFGGPAV